MLQEISKNKYCVKQMDGAEGMLLLPDKSIKLIYGSPPYPNAEREYGVWRSSNYIKKMTPFLDAACAKLRDDGFNKPEAVFIIGYMNESFDPDKNAMGNGIVQLMGDVLAVFDIERPKSLAEAVYDECLHATYSEYSAIYKYEDMFVDCTLVAPDEEHPDWSCMIIIYPENAVETSLE